MTRLILCLLPLLLLQGCATSSQKPYASSPAEIEKQQERENYRDFFYTTWLPQR